MVGKILRILQISLFLKELHISPFSIDSAQSTYSSTPHSPRSKNDEKSGLLEKLFFIGSFQILVFLKELPVYLSRVQAYLGVLIPFFVAYVVQLVFMCPFYQNPCYCPAFKFTKGIQAIVFVKERQIITDKLVYI